jgi:hypothetical protein
LSSKYREIALTLTNKEFHLQKEEYDSSLKIKTLIFEFFNYYFNLYYIAFYKSQTGSCPMNDCYTLLAKQLTGLLLSAVIVDTGKLIYNAKYQIEKTKQFENNLKNDNNLKNTSTKFIYYTRTEYENTDTSAEVMEIILNFGYIIQFGASSPVCFSIALLQTMFMRFLDSVKFSKLQYVRNIRQSQGIGVYMDVLKLITILGLVTNCCIIFFTNPKFMSIDLSRKLLSFIILENIIIVIMMATSNGSNDLPLWFKFKDKIEGAYLNKYTVNNVEANKSNPNNDVKKNQ